MGQAYAIKECQVSETLSVKFQDGACQPHLGSVMSVQCSAQLNQCIVTNEQLKSGIDKSFDLQSALLGMRMVCFESPGALSPPQNFAVDWSTFLEGGMSGAGRQLCAIGSEMKWQGGASSSWSVLSPPPNHFPPHFSPVRANGGFRSDLG